MRREVLPSSFYHGNSFFEGQGLPLQVLQVEDAREYPPHRHDFSELVVVSSGSGIHASGGTELRLKGGDVIFIPEGTEHAYRDTRGLSYVNVIFDRGLLAPKPHSGKLDVDTFFAFQLSPFAIKEVLSIADRIDRELFRKELAYEAMAASLLEQLWAILVRARSWSAEGKSTEERVRIVFDRINNNPALSLSVDEMAEEAATSSRNFRREFKRIAGEAPTAFIRHIRLEEACALLESTDKTVSQIASLVGFEDPSYFTRAFTEALGSSPTSFRTRQERLPRDTAR
jgi:AraC-type DNA-binding domain-containing proteins